MNTLDFDYYYSLDVENRHLLNTMSNLIDRITIDPDICNGKPIIRGKRIAVQTILEFLSSGDTRAEILEEYPSLAVCQRK